MKTLLISPKQGNNKKDFAARYGLRMKKEHSDPIELTELSIELPLTWERKLVDLNDNKLLLKDVNWAELIFIRAESPKQARSVDSIVRLCSSRGKKIALMGSMFRNTLINFDKVDHLIQEIAEVPCFICDLENELSRKIYGADIGRKQRQTESPETSLAVFSGNLQRSLQEVS